MSSVSSPAALPHFISQLLSERQQHVADIAVIDATLTRVSAALGGSSAAKPAAAATPTTAPVKAKRGRKPGSTNKPKTAAASKAAAPKATSGMTAHEFVLSFVSGKKNPSTQDVNKHWKASGRLGNADNTMSQLTKLKKLKRTPLTGGQRGSTYAAV